MARGSTVFRSLILAGCLLTPALAVDIEKPERLDLDGSIHWVYDYEEGQKLSEESGRPMFVVFRCER